MSRRNSRRDQLEKNAIREFFDSSRLNGGSWKRSRSSSDLAWTNTRGGSRTSSP